MKNHVDYDNLLKYISMNIKRFNRRIAKNSLTTRDVLLLLLGALIALGGVKIVSLMTQPEPLAPETKAVTISWLPSSVTRWNPYITQMSQKYDIDPNLLAIIITMESGGNSKAQSEAGAEGLMQVTPPTGKDIAEKYLKQPSTKYDLYDPKTNIEFGAAYLSYLRKEFGDPTQGPSWNATVELVAAGYNGGPGAAGSLYRGLGLHDTQTVVYSRDAFNMWRERKASSSPTFDRWKERGGSSLLDQAAKETVSIH